MAADVLVEGFLGATGDLIECAAESFGWDPVRVRPLRRFGYSGARVLVIRGEDEVDPPHILKIAEVDEIATELRATRLCEPAITLPTVHQFESPTVEEGKRWAALSYRFYQADGPEPVDLTEHYSACMRGKAGAMPHRFDHSLADLLDRALRKMERGHLLKPRREQKRLTYREMFKPYLRDNPSERPNRVSHTMANDTPFAAHGWTVNSNPLHELPGLLDETSFGYQARLIHGDLHLSNIVVDGSLDSNLIDFKWANRGGHLLIDYALLESSLRFAQLPHDIHPATVLAVDRELNIDVDGGEADRFVDATSHALSKHRLREMILAVRFVRDHLRNSQPLWDSNMWREYQRTLYILLSGQQRLETFPLMRTIVNLHQLKLVLTA